MSALEIIDAGTKTFQGSFPIPRTEAPTIRGIHLGKDPTGSEEVVAVFTFMHRHQVPKGYHLGRIVFGVVLETELEQYVQSHGLEFGVD